MSGQRQSWGTLWEVSSGTWRTWRTLSRFSSLSSSASSSSSWADCGEESEQVPHRLNRAGCPQELYTDNQGGGGHFIDDNWVFFGWIFTFSSAGEADEGGDQQAGPRGKARGEKISPPLQQFFSTRLFPPLFSFPLSQCFELSSLDFLNMIISPTLVCWLESETEHFWAGLHRFLWKWETFSSRVPLLAKVEAAASTADYQALQTLHTGDTNMISDGKKPLIFTAVSKSLLSGRASLWTWSSSRRWWGGRTRRWRWWQTAWATSGTWAITLPTNLMNRQCKYFRSFTFSAIFVASSTRTIVVYGCSPRISVIKLWTLSVALPSVESESKIISPDQWCSNTFLLRRMLDEFGAEIEHADSRVDATLRKVAKVLHLSDGNILFWNFPPNIWCADRRQWMAIGALSSAMLVVLFLIFLV